MKVTVFPFKDGVCHGNIMWAERDRGSAYYRVSRYAMRNGKFPADHPVGGDNAGNGQGGTGANIAAFRALGYWASCFPEGDGITWKPLNGQSHEQSIQDIKDCFGWEVEERS